MATRIPSFKIASWTWPIEAAAKGKRLISLKFFCHSCPNSFTRLLVTYFIGIMSAPDLAFSRASLIMGGKTESSLVLNSYPILRAPPLIFLKFIAKRFAFRSLSAYLAIPPCSPCLEIPTFCLNASAIVPPTSCIPSIPKCMALLVALLGTYRSTAVNLGRSCLMKNGTSE